MSGVSGGPGPYEAARYSVQWGCRGPSRGLPRPRRAHNHPFTPLWPFSSSQSSAAVAFRAGIWSSSTDLPRCLGLISSRAGAAAERRVVVPTSTVGTWDREMRITEVSCEGLTLCRVNAGMRSKGGERRITSIYQKLLVPLGGVQGAAHGRKG